MRNSKQFNDQIGVNGQTNVIRQGNFATTII